MDTDSKAKKEIDKLFQALTIAASGKYVFLTDLRCDLSRWSKQAVDYFGLPDEYMYAVNDIWTEHVHPDDREIYLKTIGAVLSGESDSFELQYRTSAKDGSYVVCTGRGTVIRDENDQPHYFGGAIQNHGAVGYTDINTGLRNLYGFFDDLKGLLWKKKCAALMMIGMTGFADINNVFGYSFGNIVLRAVGNWLKEKFGRVYRMDGTKFAVISEEIDAEGLRHIYTQMQMKAAEGLFVDSERVNIALNAGIVFIDEGGTDATLETVYSCLTFAYTESKKKCHGEAVIFNDALSDSNRQFMKKLNYIRASVTENCRGFYLCYQPIVDAKTEKLKGVEALLRWKDPQYGVVPPIQFISVLEQDALFPVLGRWILRTAMTEGRHLLKMYPDLIVNVNLAYSQLEQSTFVNDVLRLLGETGFPAQNLCLEITERCRILDINMLKQRFTALRANGIRLALDDFGTGFSSIGLLREIPIDTIKVDREYVKNVTTSVTDQSTIRSITRLADAFYAEICAEGIEDLEMREYLLRYHVTSLQGYYYGKPVPLDQFIDEHQPPEDDNAEPSD